MKKLISLVIAVALVVCLLPVMASAAATELQLDCTEYTNYVGEWLHLYAYDENGDNFAEVITWTSSDPAVAVIDNSGENRAGIKLLAQGTATITAECGSLSATCAVTVLPPKVLTLDTPLTLEGDVIATFTPAAAGTYTIYVPEANCNVNGYIESTTGYNEFATATDGRMRSATITLAAGEVCNIYTYSYINTDQPISYKLSAVKTPAIESLALNTDKVELIYVSPAIYPEGMVYLNPTPVTAALPANLTWKMKDDTVAQINYDFGGFCYFGALKVGTTVLEVYDGETLIDSVEIVVKAAMDVAQPLYWGVEYDIDDTTDQIYLYTPSVTDTYTFQSFREKDEANPRVDILIKDGEDWTPVEYFDDNIEGLDFNGQIQLEKGTEYMIVVGTLNELSGYSFCVKGTAASDPGYDLKKVAASPADCTTDGNIEYYECQKTGIKFANETATKLAGEVVIKATGHKLDKVEATKTTAAHEKCSVCSALFLDGKEVTEADLKLDNPPTGDSSLLIPFVALVVLSTLGLGITAVARKRA